MVSFVILLVARTARIACADRQTDRQNDKPSTVTLAAHARPRVNNAFQAYFIKEMSLIFNFHYWYNINSIQIIMYCTMCDLQYYIVCNM